MCMDINTLKSQPFTIIIAKRKHLGGGEEELPHNLNVLERNLESLVHYPKPFLNIKESVNRGIDHLK